METPAMDAPVEAHAAFEVTGVLESLIEMIEENPVLALSVLVDDLDTQARRASDRLRAATALGAPLEMTADYAPA